ncbi:ATP-binding protein [Vibrio cholerae]|uniref:ATP-binding protein n=2 Tax=Vibrio cholerae TaxID=666 RepID=UPI0011D77592|nr:ATP-binding protein [Vibrio cholerae]EJB5293371.1 ATP-binding protein [Vibrio cholerae]EJL6419414.1 ATP-binding protein [Vibrio cholerae]EKF9288277.1 ATP-binding protein [Vibrio cholerae]EKF9581581.1 ATP-binding protein [Vibrio cholerae]ELA6198477.1 ATP-binding protein [Vibrio cholerae]
MKEKEYKISIDPRILELLGPNLYTNIYYILAELIANAYDANAKNVYIIKDSEGNIVVEDDGHGMAYDEGVQDFLNVARESRTNDENTFVYGSNKQRKKMGRKGVGKLAALSISENVEVKTIKDGDKSGFILSRNIGEDRRLKSINDNDIQFYKIKDHGTSILMRNPSYDIHKTLKAAKRNLLKIFPLVNNDFKIHIQLGNHIETISAPELETIKELGALITLGEDFEHLHSYFDSKIPNYDNRLDLKQLQEKRPLRSFPMLLKNKEGYESNYILEVRGWVGARRNVSRTQHFRSEFSDNYISLLSNNKLGEFNILKSLDSHEALSVYYVGQLYIDLFEETSLPDMALSNRQGYKDNDERYVKVMNYIKDELLPSLNRLRLKYSKFKKSQDQENDNKNKKLKEKQLVEQIKDFKVNISSTLEKKLKNIQLSNVEEIIELTSKAINQSMPNLNLKTTVEKNKKKLLISQTKNDKNVADLIYDLLVFSGIPPEDILYSNSDNEQSSLPIKVDIFDYLRDFFVDSYSAQKIYVVYVTSEKMKDRWGVLSEVGAGWITKSDHDIFNINGFIPEKPLNTNETWANIEFDREKNIIRIDKSNLNVVANKLIYICNVLNYKPTSKDDIKKEICKRVEIF